MGRCDFKLNAKVSSKGAQDMVVKMSRVEVAIQRFHAIIFPHTHKTIDVFER